MSVKKLVYAAIIAMVVLALTACGAANSNGSVEVKVKLTEFGIESSRTEFKTGVTYRFVVTNAGQIPHEFMIMPPLMIDNGGMNMGDLDAMALAMIPEEELPAGTTKTLEFTFKEPAPAGTLEFACHTPGHYEAGMKLPITVQ